MKKTRANLQLKYTNKDQANSKNGSAVGTKLSSFLNLMEE